jgi:hypothetical protein
MADPAKKLDPGEETEDTVFVDEELRAKFVRGVESLHSKAVSLRLLAEPLREECTETAELARKCEEAVGEI